MSAPKTILVVEDDELFRRSVVAFLDDCGFRVVEAADGKMGVQEEEKWRPDLVITDLRMPGMGGVELMRSTHAVRPELPFIIVSGTADNDYLLETLKMGAAAYLNKPILDFRDLDAAIASLLSSSRAVNKESL